MDNTSLPKKSKKSSKKNLFYKDLKNVSGTYSDEIINQVENNSDLLIKEYIKWNNSLVKLAEKTNISASNLKRIPYLLEKSTFNKIQKKLIKEKPTKIILGIAGPGAVGKETIKNGLGFNMVINTTTREKRDYEIQDKHYHFISNNEYKNIVSKKGFVISMNRLGRGQYGIQKNDIEKIILNSKVGIVEENPKNLTAIKKYIESKKDCKFILVYILPPSPIFCHLACRLAYRCKESGENFSSAINSTLGERQLKELNSVIGAINKKIDVVFLINDKVNRAIKKLKTIL
ncbi:MAG: hypothetical protein WC241_04435 [Candidatus Paceibacterota bacterium]|jgi:guanylate kinase